MFSCELLVVVLSLRLVGDACKGLLGFMGGLVLFILLWVDLLSGW